MTSTISYTGAAAKYQYQVMGKMDGLLQNVGSLTSTDSSFSAFKRKRIAEKQELASVGDKPTKSSIQVEMSFLKDALNIVKSAVRSDREKKGVDSALVSIAAEMSSLVTKYNTIKTTTRTNAEDQEFMANIKEMMADVKRLNSQQNILSRGEGIVYNATVKSVAKVLASIDVSFEKIQDAIAYRNALNNPPVVPDENNPPTENQLDIEV